MWVSKWAHYIQSRLYQLNLCSPKSIIHKKCLVKTMHALSLPLQEERAEQDEKSTDQGVFLFFSSTRPTGDDPPTVLQRF